MTSPGADRDLAALDLLPVPAVVFCFADSSASAMGGQASGVRGRAGAPPCRVNLETVRLLACGTKAEAATHLWDMARVSVTAHQATLAEQLAALVSQGDTRGEIEWVTWRLDGELLDLAVNVRTTSVRRYPAVAICVLLDCTERKRAETAATLYRSRLEQLMHEHSRRSTP